MQRTDTPLGPVWMVMDGLSEDAAKHYARLDLAWPDIDGFVAMHTGPPKGGAWVVRAPLEALVARHMLPHSAAELPVKDGTVWPPISEEGDKILKAIGAK